MIGEPSSNCRDLAIWQQRHNPSSLEIADDRSVAAIASKGPIVNADNGQRISSKRCPPSYNPKQRIVADRQHQSFREARCWSAAQYQPQVVDDAIQPCRPARPGWENIVPEPFGENPPPTMRHLANEPPRDHAEPYFLACTGQIRSLIKSDESLTLSITNPIGTSDEIRMPARMVLIPPLENRKLGRKHHQI